jgi:hypothetical protein
MKTTYPYYVAVKVDAGQLVKVYRDKKFKSYSECYNILNKWFVVHPNPHNNGQYAIIEYTSQYDGKIVTIITKAVETCLLTPMKF